MNCIRRKLIFALLAVVFFAAGCGPGTGDAGSWVGRPSLNWGPGSNSLYNPDSVTLETLCSRFVDECGFEDFVYYECLDMWGLPEDECTSEANALYLCIDLLFDCGTILSDGWWDTFDLVCAGELEAFYNCWYLDGGGLR